MLIGVFALLVSLYLYWDSISGALRETSRSCWAMVTRQRKASRENSSVLIVDESVLPEKPSAAILRPSSTRNELSSMEVMTLRTTPAKATDNLGATIIAPSKVARV